MPSFKAGRGDEYKCLTMSDKKKFTNERGETYYTCVSAECPDSAIPKYVYVLDGSSNEYKQIGTYNIDTITYMTNV